ncbi:MAG: acetate--CoA ligase family protein [Betaproteobacteria bacterium]|jgi:acyl-CoA synthetase (NDP forming)|nr:acetate--CoA ligase family protein [Betaproteobacteria bacterium]MDH5343894.1 acetate--CoA ligase family protein [Betaproteobacteria bacterium]
MSKANENPVTAARNAGRSALDESAGKELLAAHGISVPQSRVAKGAAEVDAVMDGLKTPVVVKVMSPDILHKSDAGGVKINLQTVADVKAAIAGMLEAPKIKGARIDGFLIEEMAPAGHELVIGGLRDPQFGPLVMVGLGGIFVEILKDVSFRLCPIARIDAEEMLAELKGAAILKGARGTKPASMDAIIDVLLKVGGDNGLLMQHTADISEADINPLIVSDTAAVAVDARFILG